ncbi:MAG: magnesium transporter [Gammaproteobacteria bacterium]|jgi:magnesium transporter
MADTPDQEKRIQRVLAITRAIEHEDLAPIAGVLEGLHPAEIARLVEALPPSDRASLWSQIDPELQSEVLADLNDEVRATLLTAMDTAELVVATNELDADDLADVLQDLPYDRVQDILRAMDEQNRQRVEEILSYSEDSAGGLMNTDVVRIRPDITLDVVQRYLRMRGELPDTTDILMVVDRDNRFEGVLPIADLLTRDPQTEVAQALKKDSTVVPASMSATEVAHLFEQRDLISAPVLDERGHLLGRITIDDAVDVLREEHDRSMMGRAGLDEEEDMFAPVALSVRRRGIWLGINLATAFLASWVVGLFEHALEQVVALAVLMPVVASMGGIAGGQTLTLVVRGMAMDQVTPANSRWLLIKEASVGLFNGLIWAVVVAAVAMAWFRDAKLGGVIAAAMILNLLIAAVAGVLIPIIQRRMGIDPALAGYVVLTTFTDVVGFFTFLGLGSLLLL